MQSNHPPHFQKVYFFRQKNNCLISPKNLAKKEKYMYYFDRYFSHKVFEKVHLYKSKPGGSAAVVSHCTALE